MTTETEKKEMEGFHRTNLGQKIINNTKDSFLSATRVLGTTWKILKNQLLKQK
jgi:hypothetical protein